MTDGPARFLFVTSSYPFHEDDVHAYFVHDMARHLVERGARVHVLTPSVPEQRSATETKDGVTIERARYPLDARAPITGGSGVPQNVMRHPARAPMVLPLVGAFVRATRRAVRARRPDAVIAHWLVPSGLAAACTSAPALFIAHSSDVHLLGRLPFGPALVGALEARGRVISTSDFLKRRMQQLALLDDCAVAPLGVRQPRTDAPPPPAPLRVCWMGRMVDKKGLLELVDALARAPAVIATLAGDGPLRDAVRARIDALGLASRVTLRGPVLDADKAAFFAAHHLFAFVPDAPAPDAFQDNLPVVCLEALAHGLPVVCTRVGALPELVSGGAGVLVSSRDELVHALSVSPAALPVMRACARARGAQHSWDACFAVLARELEALEPRAGARADGVRRAVRALRAAP